MAGVTPSGYLAYLKSGEFSDLTIMCKDVEFKVHRLIMCAASSYFVRAYRSGLVEATTNKFEFKEDDPEILSRVILWIYTSDYDPSLSPAFLIPNGTATANSSVTTAKRPLPADVSTPGSAKKQKTNDQKSTTELSAETENPSTLSSDKDHNEGNVQGDKNLAFEALRINALVYKSADYLNIEPLRLAAAERFMTDAVDVCLQPDFAAVLRLVFENTRIEDEHLRHRILRQCLSDPQALKNAKEVTAVLKKYEYSAWRLRQDAVVDSLSTEKACNDRVIALVNNINANFTCPHGAYVKTFRRDYDGSITMHCHRPTCSGRKV